MYCEKVKNAFLEKGIVYEERNIENDEFLAEAQTKNIKSMPFLIDTTANISMGESDDIIDYISEYAF